MANDSSTGGYLLPTTPSPAEDLNLDAVLQGVMAGVTGLPAGMVRSRVQPNDPLTGKPLAPIPGANADWCAVEVTVATPDDTPAQIHMPDGLGYTILRTTYRLDVLASFFGPNSDRYAGMAHDGLYIAQNREAMRAQGLNFLSADAVRRVPEVVNSQNRRRADLPMRFAQTVSRRYEIRNVRELDGGIRAASGPRLLTNVLTTVPPTGA